MDILTVKEVAELFGVHPETVRNWLRSGRLEGRRVGWKWFIVREDVDRLLKGGDSVADSSGDRPASAGSSSHAAAEDSQTRYAGSSSGPLKVRIIG